MIGGSGLDGGLGGMAVQPVAAGYGAAFNNAAVGAVGGVIGPAADGPASYATGPGHSNAVATQWAQSALAAGYMPGGRAGNAALGGYGAAPPANGTVYSGSARLGSAAVPAGTVVPNGGIARPPAVSGFASGAITEGVAGYAGSSSAAAAASAAGLLVAQQLHQAVGGQQLQHQQQHQTDAAATLVAEHLEAAHRAYKAGRHLEALQLCNTVRRLPPDRHRRPAVSCAEANT